MFLNTSVLPILLRYLLNISPAPSAVVVLSCFISSFCGIRLHTWAIVISAILSVPVGFAARTFWIAARDRRTVAAIRAVLPPVIQGKWPGNIDMLWRILDELDNGYPGELLVEISRELGHTVNVRLLWEDTIFTTEPENIKAMLVSDFHNYEKGPEFREFMLSVLGNGVFNSDGDMWKFHRAMTRPFFSRERISHFDLFDRYTEDALTKIKLRLRAGHPIDFQDIVSRFTLDSATEFLFGHCVNSLSANLPYPSNVTPLTEGNSRNAAEDFARAFAGAQEVINTRGNTGWIWPFLEIFRDKSQNSMNVVNGYLDPILKDVLTKAKDSPPSQDEDNIDADETLLDHLVKYTSDPIMLRDEIINILIAGRDTTAATLTFAVYSLAMYPHVLTRLREEILTHVGPTPRPMYDDIREMKYLRAVLNETLRLFPAVPMNMRTSIKATTWPSSDPNGKPIFIPAGTCTSYSVLLMHRRKDLWGPDAEEFDPDRFLDARLQKYLIPRPFIFLPFNAGPRICLGQQFAYNEMSFFLIRLLQKFDSITLDPDAQPPYSRVPESWKYRPGRQSVEKFRPKIHLTMYAAGGLWVNMTEAV